MSSRDLTLTVSRSASSMSVGMEEDLGFVLSPVESGIFSATDAELTEEEFGPLSPEGLQVSRSSQPQPSKPASSLSFAAANYDALLEKYWELADMLSKSRSCEDPDPFRIVDYDEMLQVLKMTPDRSCMQVTAKLLEFALQVFMRQTDLGSRYINRLLEIIGQIRFRSRRGEKRATQAEDASNSQDSGFGDDVQYDDENSSYSQSRPNSSDKTMRPFKQSKGKGKGTFLSHDGSILFDFSTASPDVITRRKMLHVKFQELASDAFNSYFDIHHLYGSEIDMDSEESIESEVNADAKPFFCYLFSKSKNKAGEMSQLTWYDSIDNHQDSEVEFPCSPPLDLTDNHDNGATGGIYSNMESENFLPSVMESFNTLVQQEQENQGENSENAQTDKEPKKGSRKQRGPLEPINQPLKNIVLESDELESEAKRARMSDAYENLDMSSLLLNGPLHSDIEATQLPDISSIYGRPSLNTDDANDDPMTHMTEVGSGEPSPLFDACASNIWNPQRPSRPVNIKKVIKKLENTIVEELEVKNREEIQFIELVQSKLNMMPPSGDGDFSTSNDSTVSVPMAFLALLHVAHTKSLYLEPADYGQVTITKRRPAEEMPPSES